MPNRRLTPQDLVERAEITDTMHRYATAIDQRDWALLRTVFADEVAFDFSSWAPGFRSVLKADELVQSLQGSLSGFTATQHVMSNHVVTLEGESAVCVTYMNARLFLIAGNGTHLMNTIGGHYVNRFAATADGWKITTCTLIVTWELGDQALSEAAAKRLATQ